STHRFVPSKTTELKKLNLVPGTVSPKPGVPAGPAGPVTFQPTLCVPFLHRPAPAGIVSVLVLTLTHPCTTPDAWARFAAASAFDGAELAAETTRTAAITAA